MGRDWAVAWLQSTVLARREGGGVRGEGEREGEGEAACTEHVLRLGLG